MPYDLIVKNGTICDGTGAPRFYGDVAVSQGKIVEVGKVTEGAARVIDADGLIVSPGFVDPHDHYDAQICWDPLFTCSSWHGVTSVVIGNCGVGIAPCRPEQREVMAWDLTNVEGMSFNVLSKGVTWDWVSFPEYMAAAEKRGLGLNVGFMAPLTPFRHYVMGEEAMERAATPEEIQKIRSLLGEAIEAGALGWTTTILTQHVGYKGRPLACRQASKEEFGSYARVLREKGRGAIEVALTVAPGILSDQEYELLDLLLRESGRPITWLALIVRVDKPDACRESLLKAEPLIKRGAIPQVNCRPILARFTLKEPFIFANFTCWRPLFNRPREEQKQVYQDPAFRTAFRKEMAEPRIFTGNWETIRVREARLPEHQRLIGKDIAEIAREQGKDPLDTFLDLALAEDLEMRFMMFLLNMDPVRVKELITDKRTMIGLSDGGAHVNLLCDAGYSTYLLGTWVRERQALTLEEAVRRLTLEPASFFGLSRRGRIAPGMAADLAIFDPQRVSCPEEPEMIYDLPGGEGRLVLRAEGIHYTVVNGTVLFEGGKHTGALPGQVLRSGMK